MLFTIIGVRRRVKGCLAERVLMLSEGKKGTGARGAPIPAVGCGTKLTRAEYRGPESRSNEGLVNSP